MGKDFLTPEDYERGFKRVNLQFPLAVAIKLNSVAVEKGCNPGTLAKMYVYDCLNVKTKNGEITILPGQAELFDSIKKPKLGKPKYKRS